MKCGDIVRNYWASDKNPIRYFVYIKNEGKKTKVIDWSGDRLEWSRYYTDDLHDTEKFVVVGHVPIKQILKDALMRYLENSEDAEAAQQPQEVECE